MAEGFSELDDEVSSGERFPGFWLRTTVSSAALEWVSGSLLAVLLILAVVSFVVAPGSAAVRIALAAVALVVAGQ